MANGKFNGVNAAKTATNIPTLIEEGQYGGKLRQMYDSYVLLADLASGDVISVGAPIPEGARLTGCTVTTGALGGSCTIDVGWPVGPLGLEAADPTAFFAALPVSSATVALAHGSTYEGDFYQHTLLEAVQVQIKEHAVSSGATGLKIQITVDYIVD